MDFISTRSKTPLKLAALPMGNWMGTGLVPSWSTIICTSLKKSAPSRSILFTKHMRGTLYLSLQNMAENHLETPRNVAKPGEHVAF